MMGLFYGKMSRKIIISVVGAPKVNCENGKRNTDKHLRLGTAPPGLIEENSSDPPQMTITGEVLITQIISQSINSYINLKPHACFYC